MGRFGSFKDYGFLASKFKCERGIEALKETPNETSVGKNSAVVLLLSIGFVNVAEQVQPGVQLIMLWYFTESTASIRSILPPMKIL